MDALVSEMKKRFIKTMEVMKSELDNNEKAKEASELSDWFDKLDAEGADLFVKTMKKRIFMEANVHSSIMKNNIDYNEIDEAKIIEDYKRQLAMSGSQADRLHDDVSNALECLEMWTKDRSKAENMSDDEKVRFFLDIPEDTEIDYYEFDSLNAKDLQALVEHDLISMDERQKNGPTVRELYEFSMKHPLFLYAGEISEKIEDERWLDVNTVYLPDCLHNFSAMNHNDYVQMKIDFFKLGITSDGFLFDREITAWWIGY